MIKKLILLSAMLLAISGCSKPQMAYEKFVEGQDVYLECHRDNSEFKYPHWYSFDTGKEGKSTGYYWQPDNPMKRLKLKDVVIGPVRIDFTEGLSAGSINRERLSKWDGTVAKCWSIGYQNVKDKREEHFEKLTKNNKI